MNYGHKSACKIAKKAYAYFPAVKVEKLKSVFKRWNRMAKKKAEPKLVIHNFVAKHMHEVNQSQVFVDRKKNAKRGYDKHKKGRYSDDYLPFLMPLLWV